MKQVYSFPRFVRIWTGRENVSRSRLLSTQVVQGHCRDRLCVTPVPVSDPKGVWVRLLLNKDHPPKVQKTGTLVPLVLPSSEAAGKWEVAGGKIRRLETLCIMHFQLLSLYVAHKEWKAPLGYSSSLQGVWLCTETTSWSGERKGELQTAFAYHPARHAPQQRPASDPVSSLLQWDAKLKSSRKHLKLIKQAGFVLSCAPETRCIFYYNSTATAAPIHFVSRRVV